MIKFNYSESIIDKYLFECSGNLAYALCKSEGYPIRELYFLNIDEKLGPPTPIHYINELPNGLFLDILGTHTFSDIVKKYPKLFNLAADKILITSVNKVMDDPKCFDKIAPVDEDLIENILDTVKDFCNL